MLKILFLKVIDGAVDKLLTTEKGRTTSVGMSSITQN